MGTVFWHGYDEMKMWLMQVDLAGHSDWVRKLSASPTARQARADFSERLAAALRPNFERVSWAGDGGLFAAPLQTNPGAARTSASDCVSAADTIRAVFREWRSLLKYGDMLGVRVSVHAADIFVLEDPTQWYSDELNRFMKYERLIGRRDAIVLTHEVFTRLAEGQERWKRWRERDAEIPWDLYTDGDTNGPFDHGAMGRDISKTIATWREFRNGLKGRLTEGTDYECSMGENYVSLWRGEWYDDERHGLYLVLYELDRIVDPEAKPEIVIGWQGGIRPKDVKFLSDVTRELTGDYVFEPLTTNTKEFVNVCRHSFPGVTGASFAGTAPAAVAKALRAVASDVESAVRRSRSRV